MLPIVALSRGVSVSTLEPPPFADTECATNVAFQIGADYMDEFAVSISANATPSNNVQAAIGIDADSNGVLEPHETEFVIGWDCGAWFARDERSDWARQWPSQPGRRALDYVLTLRRGVPDSLEVKGRGVAYSSSELPATLFCAEWNCIRVTSRGNALRDEFVAVKPVKRGLFLQLR